MNRLLGLIVSVWLVGIGAAVVGAPAGGGLEKEISALKAKEIPTTMAELIGKPVPDSQNAALVYQKAFKAMGLPGTQADFTELAEFVKPTDGGPDQAIVSAAKDMVTRYRGALPLVEKAVALPKCRFAVAWNSDSMHRSFPHHKNLECLSYLVASAAIIDAESGDMSGAAHKCELAAKISGAMKGEPGLESFVVSWRLTNTACACIRACLRHGSFAEGDARKLAAVLAGVDFKDSLKLAYKTERVTGIRTFRQIARGRAGWAKLLEIAPPEVPDIILKSSGLRDRTLFFKGIAKLIDSAGLPWRDVKVQALHTLLTGYSQRSEFFTATALPVFSLARTAGDEALANARAARVMLALDVYHQAKDSYPSTLDELKTTPGWEVPADPFSGKAFVYKTSESGYVLYSVGWDLGDNGGVAAKSRTEPGDIIWKTDH